MHVWTVTISQIEELLRRAFIPYLGLFHSSTVHTIMCPCLKHKKKEPFNSLNEDRQRGDRDTAAVPGIRGGGRNQVSGTSKERVNLEKEWWKERFWGGGWLSAIANEEEEREISGRVMLVLKSFTVSALRQRDFPNTGEKKKSWGSSRGTQKTSFQENSGDSTVPPTNSRGG